MILAPVRHFLLGRRRHPCRKRGLTLYGAGMHYDPLISSLRQILSSVGDTTGSC